MNWKPVDPNKTLSDPRSDVRKALTIEQCRISDHAVYFYERQYLPLSAITKARVQPSVIRPNHSCGIGLPITFLLLFYGEEKPVSLQMSKKENAEKALSLVLAGNPDIVVEEYMNPNKAGKPCSTKPFDRAADILFS